jgi:hypothetical protein
MIFAAVSSAPVAQTEEALLAIAIAIAIAIAAFSLCFISSSLCHRHRVSLPAFLFRPFFPFQNLQSSLSLSLSLILIFFSFSFPSLSSTQDAQLML